MALTAFNLLDAVRDMAYVVDRTGVIVAVGQPTWQHFALRNKGQDIADSTRVIGRQIWDFISGEDVRDAYRKYMATLESARIDLVEFDYRCDAPSIRREMRLMISAINGGRSIWGYLFQSLTLNESSRPPINIFDPGLTGDTATADKQLPLVTMCSYCHNVRLSDLDSTATRVWVTAEEYYRRGGSDRVRISHGICPPCRKTKVDRASRKRTRRGRDGTT